MRSARISRKHRRRAPEEVENHIYDGAAQHMLTEATQSEAGAQVIAELGPPEIVGAAFIEETPPASTVTGVRRWLPLVLPAALFTIAVAGAVWTTTDALRTEWTYGRQLAMWWYGRTAVIGALLVYAAAFSIRRADRDAAWRLGAWACTGCVVAYLLLDYGSRLLRVGS